MTDTQINSSQGSETPSPYPGKVVALLLTLQHLEKIRAAAQVFHQMTGMTAADPDWRRTYTEWVRLAEDVAVVLISKMESLMDEFQPTTNNEDNLE